MGSQILLQRASLLLAGLALAIALALLGWRIYDQVEDTMKILMTTVIFLVTRYMGQYE